MENKQYEDFRNITKDSKLKQPNKSRGGDYLTETLVLVIAIGWNVSPRKIYWSPPKSVNLILVGNKAFALCEQVKMQSLESVLIQYDWCLKRRRKFGHKDPQRGRMPCDKADWNAAPTSQRVQGTNGPTKPWKRQGRTLPYRFSREHGPCWHFDCTLLASKIVRGYIFCCFKPSQFCDTLLWQP